MNPMEGRLHTAESRAKMSAARRANPMSGEKNGMFGRKHTEESKAKMRLNSVGKNIGNKSAAGRKYSTSYYERHREAVRARVRARMDDPQYRKRQSELKRASVLKMRYGIAVEEYDSLLEKQNGKCAICHTTNPGTKRSTYFDVDHCHTTKKVRALLCRNCNVTVGVVEKKLELIKLIHSYLDSHKKETVA